MTVLRRIGPWAAIILTTLSVQVAAATVPLAVVADPARDATHPASNRPSAGVGLNALLMRAAGNAPKPTLVLLHGLPGNEQNLDLAQAVRRAGWNVLTLHYRGSWGSPGNFSIQGAVEDAAAAMAFLRLPENMTRYQIAADRLFIGGHSMGGFAAARYAAAHPEVAGVVLIDAWNVGADSKALLAHPDTRGAFIADLDDDLGNSLAGTDAARLADEVARHASDWDLNTVAAALAIPPTLVIGATHGGGAQNKALAEAIGQQSKGKGKLRYIAIDSDHAFSDHRIALASAVVHWLQGQVSPARRRD